jgi:NAD(P)-dependent dehydrogenase (short-subunit alcohol dehydrogenase family)
MRKRIALVTGAAKGIGKAIATRLVQDGLFVILVDSDQKSTQETAKLLGEKNVAVHFADISEEFQVIQLFETIVQHYQKLDAVINNAGIINDNLIWNMSAEEFDQVVRINLKGTWLMCREAAKLMKLQQSGRIINISSRAWMGNRGQTNYSASKAGVIGLTRALALELGPYNVLVNAIAPGLIDTPLTQKLKPEILEKLIQAQPTKSIGSPDDVANAVSFLVSPKTNFISGQLIYVDGGKSIGAAI